MNVRKKKESKRIRHRRGVYNHGSAVISTRARLNKEWAGKKKKISSLQTLEPSGTSFD